MLAVIFLCILKIIKYQAYNIKLILPLLQFSFDNSFFGADFTSVPSETLNFGAELSFSTKYSLKLFNLYSIIQHKTGPGAFVLFACFYI